MYSLHRLLPSCTATHTTTVFFSVWESFFAQQVSWQIWLPDRASLGENVSVVLGIITLLWTHGISSVFTVVHWGTKKHFWTGFKPDFQNWLFFETLRTCEGRKGTDQNKVFQCAKQTNLELKQHDGHGTECAVRLEGGYTGRYTGVMTFVGETTERCCDGQNLHRDLNVRKRRSR